MRQAFYWDLFIIEMRQTKKISRKPATQNLTRISQTDTETIISTVTKTPVAMSNKGKTVSTPTPKVKPTATPKPKAVVTKAPKATAIPVPTKKVVVKPKPTVATKINKPATTSSAMVGKSYTVKSGDTLWSISENAYGSGYNWVDINRANNLFNSDIIQAGDKLFVPKVVQKTPSSEADILADGVHSQIDYSTGAKITTGKYLIQPGDNLWNIAVRAYGDGYQWVKIAKINNLSNPDLIYAGNNLMLPRK